MISVYVEPKGIKRVYNYANKFIKYAKAEYLDTLEKYFVREFDNKIR